MQVADTKQSTSGVSIHCIQIWPIDHMLLLFSQEYEAINKDISQNCVNIKYIKAKQIK